LLYQLSYAPRDARNILGLRELYKGPERDRCAHSVPDGGTFRALAEAEDS
jgi:hypothetical protein